MHTVYSRACTRVTGGMFLIPVATDTPAHVTRPCAGSDEAHNGESSSGPRDRWTVHAHVSVGREGQGRQLRNSRVTPAHTQ